jgi:methylenetetrahydrofolate reductase (NADH)
MPNSTYDGGVMRISDILSGGRPVFSFEFFPPQTEEGTQTLFHTIGQLRELEPDFVSVTYGAGGGTRDRTLGIVSRIRSEVGIEPMAHFTCVGSDIGGLRATLDALRDTGIENVLALRGDPPNGDASFIATPNGLSYGSELARLITDNYDFCVGGACYPEKHPESESLETELAHTKIKVEAGAKFLITQLFFDNRAYFSFVARARELGITVPIIPGIMPVTNVAQITRFVSRIRATFPDQLAKAFEERRDDPDAVVQLGVGWATLQCAELLAAGAPGIHFYTLNRSPATRAILSALKVARPWESASS